MSLSFCQFPLTVLPCCTTLRILSLTLLLRNRSTNSSIVLCLLEDVRLIVIYPSVCPFFRHFLRGLVPRQSDPHRSSWLYQTLW